MIVILFSRHFCFRCCVFILSVCLCCWFFSSACCHCGWLIYFVAVVILWLEGVCCLRCYVFVLFLLVLVSFGFQITFYTLCVIVTFPSNAFVVIVAEGLFLVLFSSWLCFLFVAIVAVLPGCGCHLLVRRPLFSSLFCISFLDCVCYFSRFLVFFLIILYQVLSLLSILI